MLIDISFKNYRSIKDEQFFSLEAGSLKLKSENTFAPIPDNENLKLLKSAVVYGANASGKTNFIRLMHTLRNFILNSSELKAGDYIPKRYYDPFLLDDFSVNCPTEITVNFIPKNKKKHRYIIIYNRTEIIYEYLGVYETSRISKIFERKNANEFVEFGEEAMQNKKEDKRVAKNNLFLSKFGSIPNEQLRDIYLYFKELEVWNIPNVKHINELYNGIQKILIDTKKQEFKRKLSKLISVADTKISEVHVSIKLEDEYDNLTENSKEQIINSSRLETYGVHQSYASGKESGRCHLSFNDQESQGTKAIFAIGGLFLEAFERENPVIIVLDEFNNSLHPDLAKFLVELFHNPKVNKNNSQLVFATHDTTLLDKKVFRKDQIWFSEKNKYGITEFYSVKDFNDLKNVRSDIPFDKWYRTGKFGAVPNIKKLEFIAEYE